MIWIGLFLIGMVIVIGWLADHSGSPNSSTESPTGLSKPDTTASAYHRQIAEHHHDNERRAEELRESTGRD